MQKSQHWQHVMHKTDKAITLFLIFYLDRENNSKSSKGMAFPVGFLDYGIPGTQVPAYLMLKRIGD